MLQRYTRIDIKFHSAELTEKADIYVNTNFFNFAALIYTYYSRYYVRYKGKFKIDNIFMYNHVYMINKVYQFTVDIIFFLF